MRRHRSIIVTLLVALTLAGGFCLRSSAAVGDAKHVTLYAGQVRAMPVKKIKRVAIGNGDLIKVKHVNGKLILIGQAVGNTNMLVWHRGGGLQAYNIDVMPINASQVATNMSSALDGIEGLKINGRAGHVVLSGQVTPEDEKRIKAATKNVDGLINLTQAENIQMKRMVYLDVQVVNFSKSAMENLGIKWQQNAAGPSVGVASDWHTNDYFRQGDVTQGGNASNTFQGGSGALKGLPLDVGTVGYAGLVTSLSSMINLAVTNGDAYILANPQLSTRSGNDATFLAGGQIPIPVSGALGSTNVQYKDYGVNLKITPRADGQGNILATIDTKVSSIDKSNSVNGYPAFLTRNTSSVVNVKNGQTVVLSGLMKANASNNITKFPWLGSIPILGALFRNKQFQANRSQLVVFVTPRVFKPGSKLNKEAIEHGVQAIRDVNQRGGSGVYMPGFGVGPGSHPAPPTTDQDSLAPVSQAINPGRSVPLPADNLEPRLQAK